MISVLDHGFVRLVESMGNDASIVQAARVSFGAGTKTVNEDKALIKYLLTNEHWTPFEMVTFKFHVKAPIFIARQWFRHRSGSYNEVSLRYSKAIDEFYVPDPDVVGAQSKSNKQGRSEIALTQFEKDMTSRIIYDACIHSVKIYNMLINSGIARELCRLVLPLSMYTEFYWSVNLRNLLHFLELRLDEHAQWEIRQYSKAICEIINGIVPITYAHWSEMNGKNR